MCIDVAFLGKNLNTDDISIIKMLFKGAVAYEDIKETLESVYQNKRIFTVTPEDILSIKTHYTNTLELKAKPYDKMCPNPINKAALEKDELILKLAPSYQRDNKFINISYYVTMEPLKKCFIGSEQANLLLYNRSLGGSQGDDLRKDVLGSLTIDERQPLPQYYEWEWDKTTVRDLIIYDAFYLKSGMLLWDYDITLSNIHHFLNIEKHIISKFYYNSSTMRLYYIKTGQDIYYLSTLYEFIQLRINLSNKKRKR